MGTSKSWRALICRSELLRPAPPAERTQRSKRFSYHPLKCERPSTWTAFLFCAEFRRAEPTALDLHDFGFLLFGHLFHFFDFFVGELLDLVEGALLFVFGNLFIFGGFFDEIVAVAADVADGGAVIFEDAVEVFDDFLATILGHGRDGDA